MKRLIACLLIALSLAVSCRSGREVAVITDEVRIAAINRSLLDSLENQITVTPVKVQSGFILEGRWDLREYAKLRFLAHNANEDDYLYLFVYLENETPDETVRPSKGISEDWVKVAPGETKLLEIDLPCDIAHPEVNRLLTLMKGTPYNEFKHRQYGVDLSDVRRIRFLSRRQYPGSSWAVEHLVLVPGERKAPDYMQLDSASFFPMIDRYGQFKYIVRNRQNDRFTK